MLRVSGRWSPKCGSLLRDAGDLVGLRLWCGLSRAPRNYVLDGGPDAAFCQITLISCLGLVVGSVVLVIKSWYKGNNAPEFRSPAVYREMMRRVGDCPSLHFARVVDNAKCIFVTCVRVRVCVCLSVAACPHYCMDPDVTWGNGRGCPLVVHYWADLQSVHGFRRCDSIKTYKKQTQ